MPCPYRRIQTRLKPSLSRMATIPFIERRKGEGVMNRWKGFTLGALGGIAGVLAMQAYWKTVTSQLGQDPRKMSKPEPTPEQLRWLDDISVVGSNHQPGESSTAALGRIMYRTLAGQEPQSEETRTLLSYLVHWVISMGVSGLYGAFRRPKPVPDIIGGVDLGTRLWFLGDETLMPLLGLTDGPTAYPPILHVHSWGAHIAYGVASAVATQLLRRVV